MDFLQVVGDRRSIRWYKTWEKVPPEKIQRILEAARLTTCPGNLQPWRAIVVDRDELDEKTREELLSANNWQGAHTQTPNLDLLVRRSIACSAGVVRSQGGGTY
jgi:nitroreductase